jgi:hypothetical protein
MSSIELKSTLASTVTGSVAGLCKVILSGDVLSGIVVAALTGGAAYGGQLVVKHTVEYLKKKISNSKK